MSAEHIYKRANEAAVSVDPMILAGALDHIARTAARSRSQTRRIRWIEQRALTALEGREYRDIDVDLPKSGGPETAEKLKAKAGHYKRLNAELLALLKDWRGSWTSSRAGADRTMLRSSTSEGTA
jgi:hypothetical protein